MKTVAVIGSGIAGLGCAWLLRKSHSVTVYEINDRPGGHTHTVDVKSGGIEASVDTGFMVYNKITYPNLVRLFDMLNVPVKPTTMSFSVSHLPSGIEYNGAGLARLFARKRNLVSPRFWKLLLTIDRFNKEAPALIDDPAFQNLTLGQLASKQGHGKDFLELYLVPMGASVWSTPPGKMLEFPATTLMRFWKNHGFLGLSTHFQWWTVDGGSREYLNRLIEPLRDNIVLSSRIRTVRRSEGTAQVVFEDGSTKIFDKVVLACHADESLALLESPTDEERRLLSPFQYQKNSVLLHSDYSIMPKTPGCWASWNYRSEGGTEAAPTVHYWMNSLQGADERLNLFVSLNSDHLINPALVHKKLEYTHPLFSVEAIAAQSDLPRLNQEAAVGSPVHYCGSYFRYGFHEDAFTSGIECANSVAGMNLWV